MQRQSLMRRHYAETLMGLCETISLADIKVSDIIEASGLSRQTLYNYFSGLDELFFFTASRCFLDVAHPPLDPRNIPESYVYAQEHRGFYMSLPSQVEYGSFREVLDRWLRRRAYDLFVADELPKPERLRRVTQLDLFVCGSSEIAYNWMAAGMKHPIDLVTGAVVDMMPDFMRNAGDIPFPDPLDYPGCRR